MIGEKCKFKSDNCNSWATNIQNKLQTTSDDLKYAFVISVTISAILTTFSGSAPLTSTMLSAAVAIAACVSRLIITKVSSYDEASRDASKQEDEAPLVEELISSLTSTYVDQQNLRESESETSSVVDTVLQKLTLKHIQYTLRKQGYVSIHYNRYFFKTYYPTDLIRLLYTEFSLNSAQQSAFIENTTLYLNLQPVQVVSEFAKVAENLSSFLNGSHHTNYSTEVSQQLITHNQFVKTSANQNSIILHSSLDNQKFQINLTKNQENQFFQDYQINFYSKGNQFNYNQIFSLLQYNQEISEENKVDNSLNKNDVINEGQCEEIQLQKQRQLHSISLRLSSSSIDSTDEINQGTSVSENSSLQNLSVKRKNKIQFGGDLEFDFEFKLPQNSTDSPAADNLKHLNFTDKYNSQKVGFENYKFGEMLQNQQKFSSFNFDQNKTPKFKKNSELNTVNFYKKEEFLQINCRYKFFKQKQNEFCDVGKQEALNSARSYKINMLENQQKPVLRCQQFPVIQQKGLKKMETKKSFQFNDRQNSLMKVPKIIDPLSQQKTIDISKLKNSSASQDDQHIQNSQKKYINFAETKQKCDPQKLWNRSSKQGFRFENKISNIEIIDNPISTKLSTNHEKQSQVEHISKILSSNLEFKKKNQLIQQKNQISDIKSNEIQAVFEFWKKMENYKSETIEQFMSPQKILAETQFEDPAKYPKKNKSQSLNMLGSQLNTTKYRKTQSDTFERYYIPSSSSLNKLQNQNDHNSEDNRSTDFKITADLSRINGVNEDKSYELLFQSVPMRRSIPEEFNDNTNLELVQKAKNCDPIINNPDQQRTSNYQQNLENKVGEDEDGNTCSHLDSLSDFSCQEQFYPDEQPHSLSQHLDNFWPQQLLSNQKVDVQAERAPLSFSNQSQHVCQYLLSNNSASNSQSEEVSNWILNGNRWSGKPVCQESSTSSCTVTKNKQCMQPRTPHSKIQKAITRLFLNHSSSPQTPVDEQREYSRNENVADNEEILYPSNTFETVNPLNILNTASTFNINNSQLIQPRLIPKSAANVWDSSSDLAGGSCNNHQNVPIENTYMSTGNYDREILNFGSDREILSLLDTKNSLNALNTTSTCSVNNIQYAFHEVIPKTNLNSKRLLFSTDESLYMGQCEIDEDREISTSVNVDNTMADENLNSLEISQNTDLFNQLHSLDTQNQNSQMDLSSDGRGLESQLQSRQAWQRNSIVLLFGGKKQTFKNAKEDLDVWVKRKCNISNLFACGKSQK
eukprot:TRINITY_DN9256_c0_g1_i5.p1 TRINITY_DN9256_c0_g1~~TRINITY_DN9256_c0_g1_i5.p1  ORF type:complete len:1253 (-),score=121.03 TRINITY_DN9256_c0_g1_i5:220-3978(-)